MRRLLASVVCVTTALVAHAQVVKVYNFSDALPYTALDFFTVPFDVPAGVAEIQVQHLQTSVNTTNILDWGLADPTGFRGWGGGNTEPAIVGVNASSRSYLINGVIQVGTWFVWVGKPRIATPPGYYSINITLLATPSLPPQPFRQPYVPSPPLNLAAGWYAGDFHVHSCESGDAFANATQDEIASYAQGAGLDFVHFSEHNTPSTSTFLVDVQTRHADILLLPGVEYTTYYGHAGAILTTKYVDHRIGLPNVTIASAAAAIHAQGGLMSINHMNMYEGDVDGDLRNDCVGCYWDYAGGLPGTSVDAVEIAIQSWGGIGFMFSPLAIEWWDHQHALGFTHIAPIGGSDDHHGGQEETTVGSWEIGSPVGSPTTMVYAANLSHAAIREGVALGRTVVKQFNALDPHVTLTATLLTPSGDVGANVEPVMIGGTLRVPPKAAAATGGGGGGAMVLLNATVLLPPTTTIPTRALAAAMRAANRTSTGPFYVALVRNNEQTFVADVPSGGNQEPFVFTVTVPLPMAGTDRWRAEVHEAATGTMTTITNHLFLPAPAP
jgi:hypothetical protein